MTLQLFEPRASFGPILDAYPGARSAAAEIRVRLETPVEQREAFALEKYLREELKGSRNVDARYRFRQIPLYLQHLLREVSRRYTTEPENYSRLVNGALGSDLDHVVFLTLNYDTILDRELLHRTVHGAISGEPRRMEDYVADQRWTLIKLHGSVNWGRRVHIPQFLEEDLGGIPSGPVYTGWFDWLADIIDSPAGLGRQIELRLLDDIRDVRRDPHSQELYYPALSVPIGPDPELGNCPREHRSELKQRLRRMGDNFNVLVIGYSGLDDEVWDLLTTDNWSRRVAIVDVDPGRVHEQLEKKLGPLLVEYFPGGFQAWAQGPDLDAYFGRISTAR